MRNRILVCIGVMLLLVCTRVTHTYEPYVEARDTEPKGITELFYDMGKEEEGRPLFRLGEPFGDVPRVELPETRVSVSRPVVRDPVRTLQANISKSIEDYDSLYLEGMRRLKAWPHTITRVDTVELPCDCPVDTVYVGKDEDGKRALPFVFVMLFLLVCAGFGLGYTIRSNEKDWGFK